MRVLTGKLEPSFAFIFALMANPAAAGEVVTARTGDAYPLAVCPVSGQKLGSMGDPVVVLHEGREVRLCCAGCAGPFEKSLEKYLEKIDAAIVKAQKPYYPLGTCVVSGKKLGSMGKPVEHVYGNRLVRFCCKGCVKLFETQAKKHTKKLNEAVVKAQKPHYPLETCVVSGKKLGAMGKPVDRVIGNRLVRLCCKGCIARLEKKPAEYLARIPQPYWSCPMHPEVRTALEGKCPICTMVLVKTKADQKTQGGSGRGMKHDRPTDAPAGRSK
jgi:hypothetical protein